MTSPALTKKLKQVRRREGRYLLRTNPTETDCLYVTLGRQLKALAPGLTARSALEKFAAVQMVDVKIPTTGGRELLLTRYTQPQPELELLPRIREVRPGGLLPCRRACPAGV